MNTPLIRACEADWNTEQAIITTIRREVFIQEQKVPEEEELDGTDNTCRHVLGYHTQSPTAVATGRLNPHGQIGRMAVLPKWRTHGLGAAVLKQLLTIAKQEGTPPVWLSAQLHAIPFYEKHGFVCEGEEYEDAGILHRKMHWVGRG